MEDMSKKGKRLEKENEGLKRHKEATAANILRLAEERQDFKKRYEAADKKAEKLLSIIQAMQQQGRAVPPGTNLDASFSGPHGKRNDNEDSEYSEEAEEEDDMSGFEDDEDTEEEAQPAAPPNAPVTYGPERPPAPAQQPRPTVNGH